MRLVVAVVLTVLSGPSLQAASPRADIRPGELWLDVVGKPINAHAGGVLYEDGTYQWYGQHMKGATFTPAANRAWGGARVDAFYSSEENATMHVVLLSDDYLAPTDRWKRLFVGRSREAPAVFEQAGRYYIITSGCTGWKPNPAEYAVAGSIMGEWMVKGAPCAGEGCDVTFRSQSTFVLPVASQTGRFVFMADRWQPDDLEDSRYVWLPLRIEGDSVSIAWQDAWRLAAATRTTS